MTTIGFTNARQIGVDPEDCAQPDCLETGYPWTCDEILQAGGGSGYVVTCRKHLARNLREVADSLAGRVWLNHR
jgi:hypothetical protein